MGPVPGFTVGLGACALLIGMAAPVTGQIVSHEKQKAPMYGELPDQRGERKPGGRKMVLGVGNADKAVPAAPEAAGPPASNPGARPSDPSPSGSAGAAVAATPAPTHAAAPASLPSGLSSDAPDTAPSIGVVGGRSPGGPSPAATPEPTTLLLMGAGLAGLYRLSRHRT